jgi:hypothetical protein
MGKYTVKGTRNESKWTVQFKLEDVTFFHQNEMGQLRCLPRDAPLEMLMLLLAEGACLKLDNQKHGWKGVCVYHQHNGDPLRCPIRALARPLDDADDSLAKIGCHLGNHWGISVRIARGEIGLSTSHLLYRAKASG